MRETLNPSSTIPEEDRPYQEDYWPDEEPAGWRRSGNNRSANGSARRSVEELLEQRALRTLLRDLDQEFPEL